MHHIHLCTKLRNNAPCEQWSMGPSCETALASASASAQRTGKQASKEQSRKGHTLDYAYMDCACVDHGYLVYTDDGSVVHTDDGSVVYTDDGSVVHTDDSSVVHTDDIIVDMDYATLQQ